MNIAGCKMVNSRSERYTASSTGRMLAWFTSDSEGVVHAGEDKPPDSDCLHGRDDPGTQRRRVGRKRRDDEEHAVDPIESSAHADRITQVADRGLISPGIPDPIQFRRVVHQRPHLDASGYQGRHDQSGELSCRADGQHTHAPPPSSPKRIISSG
jgi:hypothetical protein